MNRKLIERKTIGDAWCNMKCEHLQLTKSKYYIDDGF